MVNYGFKNIVWHDGKFGVVMETTLKMNIEQTEKDKKLIELNNKYPRIKDQDIAIIREVF